MTNLDAKDAKRSVFYKGFFKNILSYMNGRLSKIRSVHTYGVRYIHVFASQCNVWRFQKFDSSIFFSLFHIWYQSLGFPLQDRFAKIKLLFAQISLKWNVNKGFVCGIWKARRILFKRAKYSHKMHKKARFFSSVDASFVAVLFWREKMQFEDNANKAKFTVQFFFGNWWF